MRPPTEPLALMCATLVAMTLLAMTRPPARAAPAPGCLSPSPNLGSTTAPALSLGPAPRPTPAGAAQNLLAMSIAAQMGVHIHDAWGTWALGAAVPGLLSILTVPLLVSKFVPPGGGGTTRKVPPPPACA